MQIRLLGNVLVLYLIAFSFAQAQTSPCANGDESGLPLPSSFLPSRLPEFQAQLKSFLSSGKYRTLNWCEDKKLRDTGPFVNGVSYGVHPTVKIYYSPKVIDWLLHRDSGKPIPDGAMIIKEQYSPPAAKYQLQPPKGIIIVRPCMWKSEPVIKELQVLPKDGKAIITFLKETGERDQVWTDIATAIEERAKVRNRT